MCFSLRIVSSKTPGNTLAVAELVCEDNRENGRLRFFWLKLWYFKEGKTGILGYSTVFAMVLTCNVASIIQLPARNLHIPPLEKDNHVQKCLGRGYVYVSSQEGIHLTYAGNYP